MTTEDLNKIAELLPILAKYPTNYQAKSLAQQIQRMLNNNQSNRFKVQKNSGAGILTPAKKTQSQLVEDKRVSLSEAKKLREELLNKESLEAFEENDYNEFDSYTTDESIEQKPVTKKTRKPKYDNDQI